VTRLKQTRRSRFGWPPEPSGASPIGSDESRPDHRSPETEVTTLT